MQDVELAEMLERDEAGQSELKNITRYSNAALLVEIDAMDEDAVFSVYLGQSRSKASEELPFIADSGGIESISYGDFSKRNAFLAPITEPMLTSADARWEISGGAVTFRVVLTYLPAA